MIGSKYSISRYTVNALEYFPESPRSDRGKEPSRPGRQQVVRLTQLHVERSQRLHLSWQSLSEWHPLQPELPELKDEGGDGGGTTKRRLLQSALSSSARFNPVIEHDVTLASSFAHPEPKAPFPP
jgi:hypothetical protein